MSKVRLATYKDLHEIRDLLLEFKDVAGYGHVKIDEMQGMRTINAFINDAFGIVIVSISDGGGINAVLIAARQEYWISNKDCFVSDVVSVSKNPHVSGKMMKMLEVWAWSLPKVVDVSLGISSGENIERTSKFYEKLGYKLMGGSWMKLKPGTLPQRDEGGLLDVESREVHQKSI